MRCPKCSGCLIPCYDNDSPVYCLNCSWRPFYPLAPPIEATRAAHISEGHAKKRDVSR